MLRVASGVLDSPAMKRALVVLLVAAASCSDSTTKPTENRAPVIASVNVSPSYAVVPFATFSLNVSASDPDNDPLTYSWAIRDSSLGLLATLSGNNLIWVPSSRALSVTASVTVSDGKLSATESRSGITVVSMAGLWSARVAPLPNLLLFYLQLTQNNSSVSGDILSADTKANQGRVEPPAALSATGALTGLRLRFVGNGDPDLTIDGQLDATGRVVNGRIVASNGYTVMGTPVLGLDISLRLE